ncbi:MAG TPA: aspartate aminotransferase family protein [Stellaceae bacterium]|nr:aspartate aminotransferase family protein [Stellaceae bacterium]
MNELTETAPFLPNSASARDLAFVLHPMTNLVQHAAEGPLIVSRGDGIYIVDDQGRRYIEGVSGLWSVTLGFHNERLAQAAYRQMLELPSYHMFRFKSHPKAIELAERLIALSPVPMSKVFFANSGSEANDTAVKLAWYYNNARGRRAKKKIIARRGGYHGVGLGSGSLTGLDRNHRDFDLPLPGFLHTDMPHHWRYALPSETEEQFATRLADNLEKLILAEGPDTVAAFIAEPVMGTGGIILPPKTYFEKVQAVLKRHDVLFIVDEVICGFGRLGDMFGSTTFGLKPDIISTAKGLSSGYLPISAVLVSEEIYRACLEESGRIGVFGHGFTYSGHPVCAAVAVEALKIYEETDIVGHVRKVSPLLQEGLRRFAGHPLVGEVRGIGLMGGLELVKDKAGKMPFAPELNVGLYIERRCQEHGAILRALGDTLTAAPPLIIEPGEIEQILRIIGLALDETYDHAKAEGWM